MALPSDIRDADLRRLRDVAAAFVTESKRRVSKSKLMKLLYFFELQALAKGCPPLGLEFRKDKFGAVCYGAFDQAKAKLPEMGIRVEPEEIEWVNDEEATVAYYFETADEAVESPELNETDRELVTSVLEEYGDKSARDLGDLTKQLPDWDELENGETVLDPRGESESISSGEVDRIAREIDRAAESSELISKSDSEVTA